MLISIDRRTKPGDRGLPQARYPDDDLKKNNTRLMIVGRGDITYSYVSPYKPLVLQTFMPTNLDYSGSKGTAVSANGRYACE
jgi:hypothetical protein